MGGGLAGLSQLVGRIRKVFSFRNCKGIRRGYHYCVAFAYRHWSDVII